MLWMVLVKAQVFEQRQVVTMVQDLLMVEVMDKDFEWTMVKGMSNEKREIIVFFWLKSIYLML